MVNTKHAFWQALVVAIILFAIGFALGFFIEEKRIDKVNIDLLHSEINILDEQTRNRLIKDFNVGCDLTIKNTFKFADKVYDEAKKLEDYDRVAKFTNTLKVIHQKYDLLRMILWAESLDLKEKCNGKFHTVVYFFDYQTENIDKKSKQAFFSRLLVDLKEKNGDKILLIPIASNLELESVNLVLDTFKIKKVPAIIIDEEKIIEDIITVEELEKTVFQRNQKKIILN